MPRNILCLAARAVIRDAETNSVSAFAILENVAPQGFPALIPEVGVLAIWVKEPQDEDRIELQFRIVNNQRQVFNGPVTITFEEPALNRTIVSMSPLVIHEAGSVKFLFLQNETVLASYEVRIVAPAPRAEVAAPPQQPEANRPAGDVAH